MSQSRSWQRKVIESARAAGELDTLYYYIEMDVPGSTPRAVYYPIGFVPTICLSDENADQWSHILVETIKASNPGLNFRVMLTNNDLLTQTGVSWYQWGEQIPQVDVICGVCGMVGKGKPGTRLGCSQGCQKVQERDAT